MFNSNKEGAVQQECMSTTATSEHRLTPLKARQARTNLVRSPILFTVLPFGGESGSRFERALSTSVITFVPCHSTTLWHRPSGESEGQKVGL